MSETVLTLTGLLQNHPDVAKDRFFITAERTVCGANPAQGRPLTMQFEPGNRSASLHSDGDHEIARAIYAAVRDDNWATVRLA